MELENYKSRTFELDTEFNVVSVLNVFIPIGFLVDAATGSMIKFDRKAYDIDLKATSHYRATEIHIDHENKTVDYYVVPVK